VGERAPKASKAASTVVKRKLGLPKKDENSRRILFAAKMRGLISMTKDDGNAPAKRRTSGASPHAEGLFLDDSFHQAIFAQHTDLLRRGVYLSCPEISNCITFNSSECEVIQSAVLADGEGDTLWLTIASGFRV
jgi:hypothetical protein